MYCTVLSVKLDRIMILAVKKFSLFRIYCGNTFNEANGKGDSVPFCFIQWYIKCIYDFISVFSDKLQKHLIRCYEK